MLKKLTSSHTKAVAEKPKYLIVEDSEMKLAQRLGQPTRVYQNLESYQYMTAPRVFLEVTDSVKFKRNSMGAPKFVSSKLSLVHSQHAKSSKDTGSKVRSNAAGSKASKAVGRRNP